MKKNLQLLIISLLATQMVVAQSALNGTIKDAQGQGVYFSTIAIYNQADSSLVKATVADENGVFVLEDLKDGDYYLAATMLGYSPATIDQIKLPRDNGKRFDLTLSEHAEVLTTVEVTGKLPVLEQRADRLVVNIDNNLTSLNSNLMDVMKRIPGMLVINDKLSMAGQSNITILINGKPTNYMDVQSLLRDMPGDNVKKVEVITQPGAEFDAQGTGPIINIILKKNSLFGTNGAVYAGLGKGRFWKYNSGLMLSHYQGDLNLSGSIGYNQNAWRDELQITRRIGDDIYQQTSIDDPNPATFRADLSLDWNLNERQRLGFSGRYLDSKTDKIINNSTQVDFLSDETTDLDVTTQNFNKIDWNLFSINPYYTYTFDTSGHKLDLDFNYTTFQSNALSTLVTEELLQGDFYPDQEYRQPGKTHIWAGQLDYTYPLSRTLTWQMGGKISKAELDNTLGSFYEVNDGNWEENMLQSNQFLFDETIGAGYTKLSFSKNKWSGTVGLRYEHSESIGQSVTLDSTINRTIGKLFPSFSLSRDITNVLGATVAYSYRIDRPNYSTLNPFVFYWDPYTYEKGNPILRPTLTHSARFNLTFEKQPFFNIEYKTSQDAMVDVTAQNDETGETYTTVVNLENYSNFNASLFFPLDFIPGISGFGGVIADHTKYDSEYLNEQFNPSLWSFTAFLQAQFKLPAKINSEITGWYNSGAQEGLINTEWAYGVSMGFSRKFLDDKLKVSLGIEDLFLRFIHADINYSNMDIFFISRWDRPSVNLKLTYKFGNQHMKKNSKRRSSASDELQRVQKEDD